MGQSDVGRLRQMAGLATPMAIRVAATLGLPDRLLEEPASAEVLAEELGVDPAALDLLLGHLATLEIVERTGTGYRTTAFGSNLCAGDDLATLLMRLDTAGGRAELAFVELAHSIATGEAAYPRRYGRDFWADLDRDPRLRESFDRQMYHRIQAQIPSIVAGYDWSRFTTVVDVGGGRGTILAALLAAHPGLRGHLVDVAPTQAHPDMRVTKGSFFDPLPPGADAYLLVDILHDWDDDHADRILARCVEAASPTARVLVVEPVGDRHADTEINLSMLAIFGGRERRLEEFRTLAAPHGLTLESVVDLTDHRCLLEFAVGR